MHMIGLQKDHDKKHQGNGHAPTTPLHKASVSFQIGFNVLIATLRSVRGQWFFSKHY